MNWPRHVFNFYLDASVHVALAVACLLKVTSVCLNIPLNNHLVYFSFFATICCYNFVKYGVEAKKYFILSSRYHKTIQFFSLGAFVLTIYHLTFLSLLTFKVLLVFSFFTGIYALPVLPRANNFRSLSGLKIFLVALVWSGVTAVMPVVENDNVISWDVGIEIFQRILIVIVLLIPFEIRDLRYDAAELGTMPQRYGVTNSKIIGALISLVIFFTTYLKDQVLLIDAIGKGIIFLTLWGVMYITKKRQSKYYASFYIEALPILWYLLLRCFQQMI